MNGRLQSDVARISEARNSARDLALEILRPYARRVARAFESEALERDGDFNTRLSEVSVIAGDVSHLLDFDGSKNFWRFADVGFSWPHGKRQLYILIREIALSAVLGRLSRARSSSPDIRTAWWKHGDVPIVPKTAHLGAADVNTPIAPNDEPPMLGGAA